MNTTRTIGLICTATLLILAPAQGDWDIEDVYTGGDAGWNIELEVDAAGVPHAGFYNDGDYDYKKRTIFGWQTQWMWDNGEAFALDINDVPNALNRTSPDFPIMQNTQHAPNLWSFRKVVDGPVSENMRIAFDSQNRPHVAFVSTATQELRLAVHNGSFWSFRTVDSDPQFRFGNAGFLFELGPDDKSHFSWHDENDVIHYARPDNANGWDIEGINGITDAFVQDMKIDSQGRVHIVYDLFTGNVHTGGLHYGINDGGPTWDTERINGLLDFGAGDHALAIDADDNPQIFTLDRDFGGPDILKQVAWNGSDWVIDTIDSWVSTLSGPEAISAEIAANGIHVLYANDAKNIRYAFQPIPEPTTLACLCLVGIGAMTTRGRRTR